MATFVLSTLFAIFLAVVLKELSPGIGGGSPTSGLPEIFFYMAFAIVFTFLILYLARKKRLRIIRGIFIFLVVYVIFFVSFIIAAVIAQTLLEFYIINFSIPAIFLYLLLFRNEWWVINSAGILMSSGISAVWGVIIGVWAAVAFLIVFAVYDYIAVYRTKHMVSLAKVAVDESLPLLFIIPSQRGLKIKDMSFEKREESSVLMIGFGDIALPSIMVVSSSLYGIHNIIPFTLLPMIGALIGMIVLLFMNVGKPAPGLPFINTGAVIGFLIAFFVF